MKAVIHEEQVGQAGLRYAKVAKPAPGHGEVRVRLKAAGMNHRDLFVLNRHDPSDPPLILGSDGAGIVDQLGEGVARIKTGDAVIINPALGWKKNSEAPPAGFEIVGLPGDGTFAEYIVLPAENVERLPEHLTWAEAGVLSLAALTAYRALFTRGRLTADQTVFIPGIGGGVATFLLQFAKVIGAHVIVTSRSAEKRARALELGADQAIDSDRDWHEQIGGNQVDLVIESIGAATFNRSLAQLRPGGTVVTFGASAGDTVEIDLRQFFYRQLNMLGSTMGSQEEYREMLHFITKHLIKPVVDQMFPLQEYQQAFQRLEEAKQFGKIGFTI